MHSIVVTAPSSSSTPPPPPPSPGKAADAEGRHFREGGLDLGVELAVGIVLPDVLCKVTLDPS